MQNRNKIFELLLEIAGSFIFAVGIFCFIEKVDVAPGGVIGISIMINYLTKLPVGITTIAINIPLLILACKFISKGFAIRSIRGLFFSSLILDFVVTPFFPQYTGDRIIGAIYGGLLTGIGLGLIFYAGSSTAGTDILSYLIEKKYPEIQLGKAMIIIDSVILTVSVFVFGNIESALFGIIVLYCQTTVLDKIVYSSEKSRIIFIISDKNSQIARRIMNEKRRGVTYLDAKGAYSNIPTKVLLCVVRKREFTDVKKIIAQEDKNAFVIAQDTYKIMGEGFGRAMPV